MLKFGKNIIFFFLKKKKEKKRKRRRKLRTNAQTSFACGPEQLKEIESLSKEKRLRPLGPLLHS